MFPESLSLLTHSQPFTVTSIVQDNLRLDGVLAVQDRVSVVNDSSHSPGKRPERERVAYRVSQQQSLDFFYSGALKSRFPGPTPGDSDSWVLGGV